MTENESKYALYEVLNCSVESSHDYIKKQYKRLCLLHHPDKQRTEDARKSAHDKFQKIAEAYSVLSDPARRAIYDKTGITKEVELDLASFLRETKNNITEAEIEADKKIYQGGEEEFRDVERAFKEVKGDFLAIFECIPHTDYTLKDERRIWKIVSKIYDEMDKNGQVDDELQYNYNDYKKSRPKKFKSVMRKMNEEEKEAEELRKEFDLDKSDDLETMEGLGALIKKKNATRYEDMLTNLAKKYAPNTKKKNAPKKKSKAKTTKSKVAG